MAIALILGLLFSPIAAAMAFLITYGEFRHHFPDKRRAVRAGLGTAGVAFLIFFLLSFAAVLALGRGAR